MADQRLSVTARVSSRRDGKMLEAMREMEATWVGTMKKNAIKAWSLEPHLRYASALKVCINASVTLRT